MNIKKRFESSSTKEIVLLYFIVILFSIFIFISFQELKEYFLVNDINKSNHRYSVKEVSKKRKKLSDVELVRYLNNKIETLNISLLEMNISKKITTLKIRGNYQEMMSFLMIISNNFIIAQFEIEGNQNQVILSMRVDTNTFFVSNTKHLVNKELKNPFLLHSVLKIKDQHPFVISAILDLEILVDNQWYKVGDIVKRYKILQIQKDKVLLKDMAQNKNVIRSVKYE